MKRNGFLVMIFLTVVGLAAAVPSFGGDPEDGEVSSQLASFNGLWIGSGKFRMSRSPYVGCPAGKEIPIGFYVSDGTAKSIFPEKQASFETEVKENGKIRFTYEDIGKIDMGEGGTDSLSIVFRGKLEGSTGEGLFTFGRCKGDWEVHKQE